MSTSLKEQLQRLAVPQTTALIDTKSRASILFDRKEAATKNRRTIYDLGVSGLQELISINPQFQQFEITLFEETTLNLERAVEHKDVNKLLDRNIRKFLHYLSPYFLLRPAHLCLEWLLRRFQVHEYNRSDLLALALPYHETNTFVRVLQTLRLRESDKQWAWLRPLQKPGVPLPKSAILNRAATDPAFLSFICKSTMDAVRELGARAHLLQAQMNFYASVVVGALENTRAVEEWHVTTVLPSLLQGLSSQTVDFVSAAYIIAAQFVTRTQLTPKLCNALVERVAAVSFDRLRPAAVLLLIWLFDTQETGKPNFSDATLHKLIQQKWLTVVLSNLAKENVAIHSICIPLLSGCVKAIQSGHTNADQFKAFLERLLNDIEFPAATAQHLISCFLDAYVSPVTEEASKKQSKPINDSDVIELDSDEEMTDLSDSFHAWYSDYLHKFERQYPTAFDLTLKRALKSNIDQNSHRSKALKVALGHRLKSFDQSTTHIYESLYHHLAKIRLHAVQTLLANLNNYKTQPQNYELLKECLADRILDDNENVVAEILKLSTDDFISILGCEKFVEALFKIIYNISSEALHSSKLTIAVVNHLTSVQVVDHYDSNLILLALMPLVFPSRSSDTLRVCMTNILGSALPQKIPFMKSLKANIDTEGEGFSAVLCRKQFLDVITNSPNTPTVIELFKSLQTHDDKFFGTAMNFAHFLLLVTACLKQNLSSAQSSEIFQQICSHGKQFPIRISNEQLSDEQTFIPLQLFSDFVISMTSHTQFNKLQHWESPNNTDLACFLSIFELVASEAFAQENPAEKLEWSKTLKEFFEAVFPRPQEKIEFLTNFYVHESLDVVGEAYVVSRLRAFKLLSAVLRNKKQRFSLNAKHIIKVSIALCSQNAVLRQQALETVADIQRYIGAGLEQHLQHFIASILERTNEISMDCEQYPLVLYTILKPNSAKKPKQTHATKMLREFMQLLTDAEAVYSGAFTAEVLKTLKHVNDEQILCDLLPLGTKTLERITTDETGVRLLAEPYSQTYTLISGRFEAQILGTVLVDTPAAWSFFEEVFALHDVFISAEGKLQPLPCTLLDVLDELAYERMPANYKLKFLKLTIETVARAENDTIFLTANKLLKKCSLDCQPLVSILERMYKKTKVKTPPSKSAVAAAKADKLNNTIQVNDSTWKEGVVLLELLENKKKLTGSMHLVSALFDVLKFSLEMEEQSAVEYTKQLALSALLHCCQKSKTEGVDLEATLPKATFRIDQIVHCMRATQNPQTHHNALMLLSHCATLFPQQVLHNIVDIFTFMGSSVVRHDDSYSFHIINNIIESIIPIVVNYNGQAADAAAGESIPTTVIPVLKVFSDIILDVPEHRRLPLYMKLMQTLGAERYLWAFLCVLFESHVIHDEKERQTQKKPHADKHAAAEKAPKRVKIALQLTNSFTSEIIVETCMQLMHYVKSLPINKEDSADTETGGKKSAAETTEQTLFDVKCRNAKQLRHYRYIIMQFLSSISNSPEFLHKVSALSPQSLLALKPYLQNFIIKTLSFVPLVNTAIESAKEPAQVKFWKVILHHVHDVLDNAISLLSPDMFLVVVHGLMRHQMTSVRRKVIELLISKLQQKDAYFDGCDKQNFHNLLTPLSEIVGGILQRDEAASNEMIFLQQTALIAIKLLSKMFALTHLEEFKALLALLTTITKKRSNISKIILATSILTIIEISSNLKAHSLAYLPKYMPQLIEVLRDQAELVRHHAPDNVSNAIISGVQKLFESLPLFLGPYIVDIITPLSSIATRISAQQNEKDQRSINALNKITSTWSKISQEVPLRVLVPSCENAYKKLMASKCEADVGVLMRLLPQAISQADRNDLTNMQSEITNFFLQALEYRTQMMTSATTPDNVSVAATELIIIEAFVTWVLKLSESSFRPLYNKVYEWALKSSARKETILTYFLLTNQIAEALKSLFVLFAGNFIDDAAQLLNESNTSKDALSADTTEYIHVELLKSILNTLHTVFLYDSKGFVNQQRFEVLHQAIVDQLENRLVLEDDSVQQLLSRCIAQLSVAVSSDILWKQLNYQVLLKTRTNVPEVRILAFNCCIEIARKLGDDFTPLLPETVPFIAELFEDENPRVEKNTRKAVQELEAILGESIQKYL